MGVNMKTNNMKTNITITRKKPDVVDVCAKTASNLIQKRCNECMDKVLAKLEDALNMAAKKKLPGVVFDALVDDMLDFVQEQIDEIDEYRKTVVEAMAEYLQLHGNDEDEDEDEEEDEDDEDEYPDEFDFPIEEPDEDEEDDDDDDDEEEDEDEDEEVNEDEDEVCGTDNLNSVVSEIFGNENVASAIDSLRDLVPPDLFPHYEMIDEEAYKNCGEKYKMTDATVCFPAGDMNGCRTVSKNVSVEYDKRVETKNGNVPSVWAAFATGMAKAMLKGMNVEADRSVDLDHNEMYHALVDLMANAAIHAAYSQLKKFVVGDEDETKDAEKKTTKKTVEKTAEKNNRKGEI